VCINYFTLQDAIECSLLDCGIGGREAIHQYWQKEVCGKAQQLTSKADALQNEYNQLLVKFLKYLL